ncbi:MAG: STAS domain-containing protein [Nitrospira sp.]|jgi:anti-anti-sigma factor|nr:STAS domain-containing protein [Nitrospira sp.]
MLITERSVPNAVVLDLSGDLTYAHREAFKATVEALRQKGCRHVILNMADVRFVDSSGLGLLALVSQNFKLAQGKISMLRPQSYVREILGLANIPKLIPVFDNEHEAITGRAEAA